MISPEIVRLVEAVRALDLTIVVKGEVERVRLNTPPEQFPDKLLELKKALMDFDKSESAALDAEKSHHKDESGEDSADRTSLLKVSEALVYKLKKATKDQREATDIVNEAIEEFAGAGWAGSESCPSNGRNHTRAQERRNEKISELIPRLTKKSIKGLDSALNDAENYRIRSLERAKKDMERRAQLQRDLEDDGKDGPEDDNAISNSIR